MVVPVPGLSMRVLGCKLTGINFSSLDNNCMLLQLNFTT